MNEIDERDWKVRDYVGNRMAADIPPEFTSEVMSEVHRTPQRRRGFAWPAFTVLATFAAAVALVFIGMGLINQPAQVGSDPSPSGSASTVAAPSPTPEASSSGEASPGPTVRPTSGEGEFGPIHSMAPGEAFADGQNCENPDGVTTVGEPSDVSYSISFPADWYTNQASEGRSACTLFAAEPFELGSDGVFPESVAIVADLPPGSNFVANGDTISTRQYTIDGVPAVRYEIVSSDGGSSPDTLILWTIAVAGNLPAEGNDRPYLIISTASADPEELAEQADILDRMVATLDIGSLPRR